MSADRGELTPASVWHSLSGGECGHRYQPASTMTVPGQNPNELLLTAEDCAFLIEGLCVGFEPKCGNSLNFEI